MNITDYRSNTGWWALACGILGIVGIGLLILLLTRLRLLGRHLLFGRPIRRPRTSPVSM